MTPTPRAAMKQYCYAIVMSDGISHDLWPTWEEYDRLDAIESDDEEDREIWLTRKTLPQLLKEGWRPVRETSMGGDGKGSHALVLLEKD